MRTLTTVLLLSLVASGAAAQQRTERGWPLAPDGALKIHNYSGRVVVTGWDRDSVAVIATVAKNMRFFGGGGRGGIKVGVEGSPGVEPEASTLELRVPVGANVWVRGAATDVTVNGVIGTVDVGTVSGNVRVNGTPRSLTAESMTGTVDVDASCETLRAKTGSGALTWRGSAGDAQLVTVSGLVRVTAGPLERARVETVSGTVRVESALRADARLTIETHGGDIDLRFPPKTPLHLDADAASVTAPGIATRMRPAGGRFTGPSTYDFNLVKPQANAPMVIVRSFTGKLVLGFP